MHKNILFLNSGVKSIVKIVLCKSLFITGLCKVVKNRLKMAKKKKSEYLEKLLGLLLKKKKKHHFYEKLDLVPNRRVKPKETCFLHT